MAKRQLDLIIKGKDEASAPLSSITGKIREMNAEARASGEQGLERVLKGGGFLGLATLAGEALNGFAEKMNQIKEQLAQGEISAAQVPLEFAKALPVIGGFVEAGQKLREFFDDDAAAAKETAEMAKQQTEYVNVQLEAMKKLREETEAFEKAIRGANQSTQNMRLEGPAAALAAARDKLLNGEADAPKDLQSGLDAVRQRRAKEIADLTKKLGDLQANMPEQFTTEGGINLGEGSPGGETRQVENSAWRRRQHQIEATSAMLKGLHKAQQDDEAKYTEEFNAKQKADQENAEAAMNKARDDAAKQRADQTQASEEEISRLQASARQSRLREEGRDREAELDALKQNAEQQKKVIDKQAEEEKKKAGADTSEGPVDLERLQEIQKVAEAKKQAIDAESAAKQAEINKKYADQQALFEQQRQDRLADLRNQYNIASLENAGKHLEAEEAQRKAALERQLAEIDRFYEERLDKLKNATDAESKAKLQALLKQKADERALAVGVAGQDLTELARRANLTPSDYRSPELVQGQHLTGAQEALREKNSQQLGLQNKINDIASFAKAMTDTLKNLYDLLSRPSGGTVPNQLS